MRHYEPNVTLADQVLMCFTQGNARLVNLKYYLLHFEANWMQSAYLPIITRWSNRYHVFFFSSLAYSLYCQRQSTVATSTRILCFSFSPFLTFIL